MNNHRKIATTASPICDSAPGCPGGPRREVAAVLVLVLLILAFTPHALAQAGLQNLQYTAATTTQDAGGRHWAYVVWDATTPALLSGRQFAVYMKAGEPSSPALFQRVAIVQRQTDPRVISSLLQRAVNLGDGLNELDDGISKLFQTMTNAQALPLPEKISAILRGSTGQPQFEANLRLLAKAHPGLALCLGLGHAELIAPPPARSTFEVREYDSVKARDLGVVGRVIVTAGDPVVLPAPGPIARKPEDNARGHLNAKLRWGMPAELRRLALLNFGFNVWRVDAALARARAWTSSPPTRSELFAAAASAATRDAVRRVSEQPILRSRDFDTLSVTNFSTTGDSNTVFFTDDNGRFRGGSPFRDGEEFYYFVTARDLLGRDGLVSTGLLARICRRLPPRAPTDVRVDNDYTWSRGVSNQVLKVNWQQSVNGPETNITAYWIYRWNSATQHMAYEGNPSFNRIAMVPHRADTNRNYFVDNGQGSPVTSTNLDETFWYTVRAVDLTACGDLPSPHSGMAYGVLRDRIGPEPPTGGVNINCIQPHIDPVPALTSVPGFEAEPTTAYFGVRVRGLHPALAFAEFRTTVKATLPVLPTDVLYETVRVDFDEASDGSREAGSDYAVPYAWRRSPIRFEVRVGVSDDLVSPWITYELPSSAWPVPGRRLEIRFFGGASVSATRVTNPEAAPITLGLPRIDYTPLALPPLWSMTIPVTGMSAGWVNVQTSTDLKTWTDLTQNPVQVVQSRMLLNFSNVFGGLHHQFFRAQPTNYLAIAPCAHYPDPARPEIAAEMEFKLGTKEYRLYRRADDGPLTLLAQGQADYDIGVIRTQRLDEAWPAGARKLCYFAQAIDRHGNPSPMVQLGDCVTPLATYVPCPVLSTITPTNGPGGEPQMLLSWFCPPDGASRFRAYVATNDGTTFPFIYSRQRSAGGSTSTHRQSTTFHRDGLKERVDFTGTFELGRIGAELGAGPKFSAVLPVAKGVKYYVKLVAINSVGRRSSCEKTRTFTYRTPPAPVSGSQVPWPARPLPPVSANWAKVSAELMAPTNGLPGIDPSYPVGIRIGTADFPAWPNYRQNAVPSLGDPRIHLYPAGQPSLRDKILPAVLYRSQLSNERFPIVSHDVVQASPLIDQIAYGLNPNPAVVANEVTLKDPFIRSVVEVAGFEGEDFTRLAFFLLDTQPVLAGAKYQYTLVRFDSSTREPIESIPAGVVTIPDN